MLVSELLSNKPDTHPDHIVSCLSTDTVGDAIEKMLKHDIGAVLINDATGLVGVFSERDVMRGLHNTGADILSVALADVMARNLVSIEVDQTVDDAQNAMRNNRIRHLIVFDKGELAGFISMRDLMAYQIDIAKKSAEMLQQQILGATQTLPM
jgi:CBS domain-containing protein